jgi:DNA-binding GntR family transcriptional regulator
MPGPIVSDTIENIREMVTSGQILPGGRLPAERNLADMLCVSRSSVRAALGEMLKAGELEVRRGRRGGYFVVFESPFWQGRGRMEVTREFSLMIGRKVGQLWTLHNEQKQQGIKIETKVISAALERCPLSLCQLFGLTGTRSLYRIIRCRALGGRPISYEQSYFDPERFPALLEQDHTGSLLQLALRHYHEQPSEIEEQIEVVAARGKLAYYLKVEPNTSLLCVNLLILNEEGKVLLFSHDHYRPDRVRLSSRNRLDR